MPTPSNPPSQPRDSDALIRFPCRFPIKVMGEKSDEFFAEIFALARRFDPGLEEHSIDMRSSSAGKYLGLTLHVWVESRAQLDDVYRALSSHPMVRVTL